MVNGESFALPVRGHAANCAAALLSIEHRQVLCITYTVSAAKLYVLVLFVDIGI